MRILSKSLLTAAMVARVAVVTLGPASHAFALNGDVKLPPPYVSRALDAVLLPIDDQVRKAFMLSPKDTGVLVLSVEPNGVADKQNIMPGDVIAENAATRSPSRSMSTPWSTIGSRRATTNS